MLTYVKMSFDMDRWHSNQNGDLQQFKSWPGSEPRRSGQICDFGLTESMERGNPVVFADGLRMFLIEDVSNWRQLLYIYISYRYMCVLCKYANVYVYIYTYD